MSYHHLHHSQCKPHNESTIVSTKNQSFEVNNQKTPTTADQYKGRYIKPQTRHIDTLTLEDERTTVQNGQKKGPSHKFIPVPYKKQKNPSEAMSTLKIQLATLKQEISKLMTLEGRISEDTRRQSLGNYSSRNATKSKPAKETTSMSRSVLQQIPGNNDLSFLNKEDELNSDKLHHILQENESVKLELKNLKTRYIQRNSELKDQNQCLNLKVQSLENIIANGNFGNDGDSSRLAGLDRTSFTLVQNKTLLEKDKEIEQLKNEIRVMKTNEAASLDMVSKYTTDKQQQLGSQNSHLNSLKEEIQRLKIAFEVKQTTIKNFQSERQIAQANRTESFKNMKLNHQRQLDNMISSKNHQINVLHQQLLYSKQLLEGNEHKFKILSKKEAEYSQTIESLKKEIQNKQLTLSQKDYQMRMQAEYDNSDLQKMIKLMDGLRQELLLSEARITECKKIITNQQEQITSFVARGANSHEVQNVLRGELERIQRVLCEKEQGYNRHIQQYQVVMSNLRESASAWEIKVNTLSVELESTLRQFRSSQRQNGNLQENIQHLSSQLQVMRDTNNQSQKLVDQLNKNTNHYQEKLAQLRMDYDQHIQQLTSSNHEMSKLVEKQNNTLKLKEKEVTNFRLQLEKAQSNIQELTLSNRKTIGEYHQLENQLHLKDQEITCLKNIIQTHQMEIQGAYSEITKLQEEIYQLGSLSSRQQQQSYRLKEQDIFIDQLQNKIQMLEQHIQLKNQQINSYIANLQSMQILLSERINLIDQQKEEIFNLNEAYRQRVAALNEERERWRRADRNSEQSKMIDILQNQLKTQAHDYDEIIMDLKKELHNRTMDDLTRSRSSGICTIDEALKGKEDEIKVLRENLKQRNLQIQRVKDTFVETKSQLDNLKSQYGVDRVRSLTERNNTQSAKDTEIMNLKHDLNLEKKTNESILQKVKYLNEQSKKKDNFIQNFLIGKKLTPQDQLNLKQFFAIYEKEFPRETIHTKLFSEIQEIQRLTQLNYRLEQELQKNGINVQQITN